MSGDWVTVFLTAWDAIASKKIKLPITSWGSVVPSSGKPRLANKLSLPKIKTFVDNILGYLPFKKIVRLSSITKEFEKYYKFCSENIHWRRWGSLLPGLCKLEPRHSPPANTAQFQLKLPTGAELGNSGLLWPVEFAPLVACTLLGPTCLDCSEMVCETGKNLQSTLKIGLTCTSWGHTCVHMCFNAL